MQVTDKTLDRLVRENYGQNFDKVQGHFRSFGKASLLRMQFKLAERTPSMAIWLGKQYLGQVDPSTRRAPCGEPGGQSKLGQFLNEADEL
jgi:hypothetical protein